MNEVRIMPHGPENIELQEWVSRLNASRAALLLEQGLVTRAGILASAVPLSPASEDIVSVARLHCFSLQAIALDR